MKLICLENKPRSHRTRKRKHSLVGPTGSPFLDETLLFYTKNCQWFNTKKTKNSTKKVTFRDEAIISMSVAGEVTDSSIVEVGRSRPQFQYSREELMNIKVLPLSKRRPECLDIACNNSRGVWDPERWHLDRKRSETPPEEEQRTGGGTSGGGGSGKNDQQIIETQNKRRSGDPRERIRKEQDGIVLSPQRRSFNSGCFVVNQPPPRRPESPIGKTEVPHREPVRRIGSGRLLTRDMWDFRPETEKMEPERTEYNYRSGNQSTRERDTREQGREREPMRDRDNVRDRDDRGERYERRSFGRDYGDRENQREMRNDRSHQMERDKDRARDRKYGDGRRRYGTEHREPEEPEWFSSGPISQHDTIELRGFDDIPEEKNTKTKKHSPAQKKRGKKTTSDKDEKCNENSAGPKGRSTPTAMDQPINPIPTPHSPISEQEESQLTIDKGDSNAGDSTITESSENDRSNVSKNRDNEPLNFNLDDFLKSDNLPGVSGLLTNGVGNTGGSGSRFSQWFKRESPLQQNDSRRPSIQDELLNNLLNDITEPNIHVPSVTESNTYFAPISPANSTAITNTNAPPSTGIKLLEMLQRGNKPNQNGQGDTANNVMQMMKNSSIKDMEVGGKVVHSLEELEARMRGGAPSAPHVEPQRSSKTEEDLSAFKKLLAQVTGGQAIPAANGQNPPKTQPITLMQLLKNQQAQAPMQVPPHQPLISEQQPHPPSFNHVGPLGPAQHPHQAQMQHENLLKVLRIQQQQQQQQQQQLKQRQQQSDMLSMMMSGQQRMVGVSPIPHDMQMLVNNAPSSRELLQRPEAQAIIQGLQQGEITRQHLIQQLQNTAMQHRHREVLVNILKMYGNTTPRAVSPHSGPGVPHDATIQQMLYQQQQRIPSPMNNALCPPPIISSNLATSPNTLSMQHSVIPHRVPSPRDLVLHTQSIMQNAMIKTKLEEQRESYRKRQEHQQMQQLHHHQPQQRIASPVNSPSKQMMSPTPLAFTPTSVLRKMTAEKEPDGNSEAPKLTAQSQQSQMQQMQSAVQLLARGVLTRQQDNLRTQASQQQQQQHQQQWTNQPVNKHPGRPIVKGGATNQFQYGGVGSLNFPQQPPPQSQPPIPRPAQNVFGNTVRSKHTMPTAISHPNVPQYNMTQNSALSQRSEPMNNQIKAQQVQSHLANMQQQHHQRNSIVLNQNYNSNRGDMFSAVDCLDGRVMRPQQSLINIQMGRQNSPGSNGGSLSPTSNQLARWFSPELLAKARAGKLPELGQSNVLSLEELERLQQASTTVHD